MSCHISLPRQHGYHFREDDVNTFNMKHLLKYPATVKECLNGPHVDEWIKAMATISPQEMATLTIRGTLELPHIC